MVVALLEDHSAAETTDQVRATAQRVLAQVGVQG